MAESKDRDQLESLDQELLDARSGREKAEEELANALKMIEDLKSQAQPDTVVTAAAVGRPQIPVDSCGGVPTALRNPEADVSPPVQKQMRPRVRLCPTCKIVAPAEAKFCNKCQAKFKTRRECCEIEDPVEADYCTKCGKAYMSQEDVEISTSDIEGCWMTFCFPLDLSFKYYSAKGPDTLEQCGVCLLPIPLCPICGQRHRIPWTNNFDTREPQRDPDVDRFMNDERACNRCSCVCKLPCGRQRQA